MLKRRTWLRLFCFRVSNKVAVQIVVRIFCNRLRFYWHRLLRRTLVRLDHY
jgi:hypothetical protein